MTTAQCFAGAVWAACAIDILHLYGVPGVAGFAGLSIVIGGLIYHRFFKRGHQHEQ